MKDGSFKPGFVAFNGFAIDFAKQNLPQFPRKEGFRYRKPWINIMEKPKFYLTTAIAYASRKPHIGNTYEIILADAIARYKRQRGYDVHFLTGTDEHGQKIEDLAKEEGISPKEYVDKVAGQIKEIWDGMNTTYSRFIRTTDEDHERVVSHIFKKLYDQGDIYKNEYEGWYCIPCESFITESQLKEGKCPDCGRDVTRTKEETYYFKMTKYADRLIKHIEENPGFIEPESRKKEMLNNFLLPGLQDLCVSRTSFKWGVPVPFDEKHVIYVWIDALSNYITALGYDVNEKGELYSKYWPADVHIIGKDILRFHTIYWPIMLMALGEPLPKKVFGHPWLLSGMDKMSKSRGNVLYADDLAAKFGVDGVRYYVLAEMPYGSDGTISYENIIKRYNTDLANNLGNLFSRTLSMTEKYFGGVIPAPTCEGEFDEDLKETCKACLKKYEQAMDTYHVADALEDHAAPAGEGIASRLRRADERVVAWRQGGGVLAAPRAGDGRDAKLRNLPLCLRSAGHGDTRGASVSPEGQAEAVGIARRRLRHAPRRGLSRPRRRRRAPRASARPPLQAGEGGLRERRR